MTVQDETLDIAPIDFETLNFTCEVIWWRGGEVVKGSKFVCGDLAWFLKEMMVLEEREG